MSSTVLDTFSSISQTECENHCNNNSGCKGIGYTPAGFSEQVHVNCHLQASMNSVSYAQLCFT